MDKRADIPFIDIARALAPLLVLWAHLGPWWCNEHASSCVSAEALWAPIAGPLWATRYLRLNGSGGHLGVLLFFLVSGFIISHVFRFEARAEFVIKRVFRIVPMLFAGLLIAYALSAALVTFGLPPILGFGAKSVADLFLSMVLLDTVIPSPSVLGVTWSLVPEAGFYAMLAALRPALMRWPVGSTYLMIALVALINLATLPVIGFKPAHYFFMHVGFILVGRAIYLRCAGLASWQATVVLGSTALATLAALHLVLPYSRSLLFGADSVAISWAVAIVLFIALIRVPRCPHILHFVSDISYSIYLLHIPVGSLVLSVFGLHLGLVQQLSFPAALFAVIATSHLTYKCIELPAQRLGRQIATRWNAPVPTPIALVPAE